MAMTDWPWNDKLVENKGDLWWQLCHVLDPRDPDDPPRPYAPILIETVDKLEKFFSDFADLWRRGADKEITELHLYHAEQTVKLRKEIDKLTT